MLGMLPSQLGGRNVGVVPMFKTTSQVLATIMSHLFVVCLFYGMFLHSNIILALISPPEKILKKTSIFGIFIAMLFLHSLGKISVCQRFFLLTSSIRQSGHWKIYDHLKVLLQSGTTDGAEILQSSQERKEGSVHFPPHTIISSFGVSNPRDLYLLKIITFDGWNVGGYRSNSVSPAAPRQNLLV